MTYIKNGRRDSDYGKFQEATIQSLKRLVGMTTTKTYWSILKTFYNGKKVPIIPPLLINDKLI